ncbi:ferredoxin family protein [Sporomusa sp. KB1]|jgi:ferredoxin like protein|uniref:ferredoxin family protein n=1 Tax=Sporomusa sp. KB1 TaxID=943346 RepID=UPI0011A8B352|nr:ferredoxin family protein [Sporomusa sp. KB1]TWH46747.1 ferredoxin like protein [Sporomusa sp. KB1]
MGIGKIEAPELLGLNKFNVDEENAHIELKKDICVKCEDKPCLFVCPAVLYNLEKSGEVSFDFAGCLECGTCRVVCKNKGIVKWTYPRGTFGVNFRFG